MTGFTAEKYDVLRELRKIRKKHYQETKHMSMEERATYYHQKSEEFQKELAEYKKNHENANSAQ
ncbi:MAG: hypothetical protein LBG58_01705 [Planctomycetaceae bacterium]|jgi:hypothetical protein|nr:hypothetical protein [Planctomycetaceae bacterium]